MGIYGDGPLIHLNLFKGKIDHIIEVYYIILQKKDIVVVECSACTHNKITG